MEEQNKSMGENEGHKNGDGHRPPGVPPKEPPGKVIHPRPTHGAPQAEERLG